MRYQSGPMSTDQRAVGNDATGALAASKSNGGANLEALDTLLANWNASEPAARPTGQAIKANESTIDALARTVVLSPRSSKVVIETVKRKPIEI
jgi:hypothetical protein